MRVNEIFYSIQGEGAHSGEAAVFIRFSGCNLCCPFCDTEHLSYTDLTEDEIVSEVAGYPASLVVITGGEPTLQLTPSLVGKLHEAGKTVAIETNGTREVPYNVDWVTVSPKLPFVGHAGALAIKTAQEVKIVFDGTTLYEDPSFGIAASHYFIQPCDTGDEIRNGEIVNQCVEFIKNNPQWKLSLQLQKILNVR
ncbi:MAG: 7-carboxy-7-deazaguanine synthase QueE [Prevotella sp.]|nr:7-carboxy-7-deazaguanine synthase QueE [Prevotella sp.]